MEPAVHTTTIGAIAYHTALLRHLQHGAAEEMSGRVLAAYPRPLQQTGAYATEVGE